MKYHGKALRKGRFSEIDRPYLVTAVTKNRNPVFNDFHIARVLVNELRLVNHTNDIKSLAWVIMPDHLHWLFVLKSTSLTCVIKQVKARSAQVINRKSNLSAPVWQRGFHDHAIREDEDIKAVARYIIANPLRARLVDNIGDYSHWDACWL